MERMAAREDHDRRAWRPKDFLSLNPKPFSLGLPFNEQTAAVERAWRLEDRPPPNAAAAPNRTPTPPRYMGALTRVQPTAAGQASGSA